MKKKGVMLIGLLLILAIIATGCGDNNNSPKENKKLEEDSHNQENEKNKTEKDMAVIAGKEIDEKDVFTTFINNNPDVKVSKLELDHKSRLGYVYKIEGYDDEKEYEEKFLKSTGELIEKDLDSLSIYHGFLDLEDISKVQVFIDKASEEILDAYELNEWSLKAKEVGKILEIEFKDQQGKDIDFKYNIETGQLIERD